jgi:hypothetical protein
MVNDIKITMGGEAVDADTTGERIKDERDRERERERERE